MNSEYDNTTVLIQAVWKNPALMKSVFQLFELLPHVCFYVKDVGGKFLWMNTPLQKLLGVKSGEGFYGRTDADFFGTDLVFLYLREDQEVMASGKPILNQPWIVPGQSEKARWYTSSKLPLFDENGRAVGTMGILCDLPHEFEQTSPVAEMQEVVDYIFRHYTEKISIETLASICFLSYRQFERRFREIFAMSPSDYILKVRIDASARLLIDSDDSVTQVALQTGFYDNSHFTRQFKKAVGLSPLQFRKKFSPPKDR